MLIHVAFTALFWVGAQDTPKPDIVKILGRDIPVEFPSSPSVVPTGGTEVGGWKWTAGSDGRIAGKFKRDGSWADIGDLYRASKEKPGALTYPVKIIIVQHSSSLTKSPAGVVRHSWATIDEDELDTVLRSLATFKGAVQGATEGAVDVKLDVTLDDDTYTDYGILQPGSSQNNDLRGRVTLSTLKSSPNDSGARWLAERVAPRINDERFETDDGTYNGPFAAVFVIHPRLSLANRLWMVDNTPVATLGYYNFSDHEAAKALPATMFEAWKAMVWPGAVASGPSIKASLFPKVVSGQLWSTLAKRSLRSQKVTRDVRVSLQTLEGLSTSKQETVSLPDSSFGGAIVNQSDSSRTLVSAEGIDYLAAVKQDFSVTGFAANSYGLYAELKTSLGEVDKSLKSGLNPQPDPSLKPLPGQGVGDFGVKNVEGPEGRPALEISFLRSEPRGHVVVAAGTPLIQAGSTGALNFDAKLSVGETVLLELVDAEGNVTGNALIGGDSATQRESPDAKGTFDARILSDDQWHQVSLPVALSLGREIHQIRIRGGEDRLSRGPAFVTLTTPVLTEGAPINGNSSEPNPAIAVAQWAAPLNSEQLQNLTTILQGSDLSLRLTALDVLARIKAPESVLALSTVARSGYAPIAAMAIRALAFQDTPDAWAIIREAVERGPFDHNRRFGAVYFAAHPDPAMAASLNFLASKSWQARMESARALAAIGTTSSQIIMAALLQSEPSPSVRLQIAQTADIKVELVARRLLYAAVNDSSQWVRAVALARLIDSTDKSIRNEALNGVKDEAIGVRLHLLEAMRVGAKEEYRPALRLAVADLDPAVRAAALRAFATQPGPVDTNEVKNTLSDPDPEVQAALKVLVAAKNLKVPPQ